MRHLPQYKHNPKHFHMLLSSENIFSCYIMSHETCHCHWIFVFPMWKWILFQILSIKLLFILLFLSHKIVFLFCCHLWSFQIKYASMIHYSLILIMEMCKYFSRSLLTWEVLWAKNWIKISWIKSIKSIVFFSEEKKINKALRWCYFNQ